MNITWESMLTGHMSENRQNTTSEITLSQFPLIMSFLLHMYIAVSLNADLANITADTKLNKVSSACYSMSTLLITLSFRWISVLPSADH